MKLYTEEQVIEFTMAMISQYEFGNKNIWNRELIKESLDCKTTIELPSDEEIKHEADETQSLQSYSETFIRGAKWMRDKIGGNK